MPQLIPAAAAAAHAIAGAFFAVGTAVGLSAGAAATFAVFATNMFAYAANAYLISAATKALQPKNRTNGSAIGTQGYEVNYYDAAGAGMIIYGNVRTGGANVIPPITMGANHEYLQQILAFAIHESAGFYSEVLFDQDVITDTLITAVSGTSGDGAVVGGKYSGLANIRRYAGTSTQTVDVPLNTGDSASFPSTSRGRGVTYAALTYKFDDKVFKSIPNPTFNIAGAKCYDPRKDSTVSGGSGTHRVATASTWEYTQNPALCLGNYLISAYGGDYDTAEIDWTLVQAAANICDASVPDSDPFAILTANTKTNTTLTGRTVTKTGGVDSAWNAQIYSTASKLPSDRPVVSAVVRAGYCMISLNTDPATDANFTSLDYALYCDPSASAFRVYESGALITTAIAPTYTNGTTNGYEMRIACDGSYVRYYVDGWCIHTTALVSRTAPLYSDSSFYAVGATTADLDIASRRRYTCNGKLSAAAEFTDNIKTLTDSMLGRLIFRDGQWRMYAGAYTTPSFSIAQTDWIGPLSIKVVRPRQGGRWNGTRCWHMPAIDGYQNKECTPRTNATYKTQDGEERIWLEINQPLCVVEDEAQAKAEFNLRQSRNQIIISGRLPPRFQYLATWETGGITFADLGWTSKIVRLVGMEFNEDGSVNVALAEEQSADWTDLAASEYNLPSTGQLPATNPTTPTAPTSLAVQQMINGTLLFTIGAPLIKPADTRYRIIRSTNSVNAAAGTIVWQGADLVTPLVMPTSRHWYYAQAVAGSYAGAYYPNTYGVLGIAVPESDSTQAVGPISDGDFDKSSDNGVFWGTDRPSVFALSLTGGVSGGKVTITATPNAAANNSSFLFGMPVIPMRLVEGNVAIGIRYRANSIAAVDSGRGSVGPSLNVIGWTGVGTPNNSNTSWGQLGLVNGVPNLSGSAFRIQVGGYGLGVWDTVTLTTSVVTVNPTLPSNIDPTSYPYLAAVINLGASSANSGDSQWEVDKVWFRYV